MKAFTQGAFFRVTVSEDETLKFAKSWPCTDFRHGDRVSFLFETRTGDLVDYQITHSHAGAIDRNGEDVAALAEDAKAYGLKRLASKLAQ